MKNHPLNERMVFVFLSGNKKSGDTISSRITTFLFLTKFIRQHLR